MTHAQPGVAGRVEGHRLRLAQAALPLLPGRRCGHSAAGGLRPARSAVQPCWAGCARRAVRAGHRHVPGVPLLLGLGERAVLWEAGEGRRRRGGLRKRVPVLGLPSVRPRDGELQRSRLRAAFPGFSVWMSHPELEAFGCYRPTSLTKCFFVSVFCWDQGIWAQTGEWSLPFPPRELRVGLRGRGGELVALTEPQPLTCTIPASTRFALIYFYLLFIYWLHWVFVAGRGLSLAAVSGGSSLAGMLGVSPRRLPWFPEHSLLAARLQRTRSWALEADSICGARA